MQTFRTAERFCPSCGYVCNASTGPNDRGPETGDLSICANCAELMVFEDNNVMRKVTAEDFEGAPIDFIETVVKMRRAVIAAKDKLGSPEERMKEHKQAN